MTVILENKENIDLPEASKSQNCKSFSMPYKLISD